MKKITILTATVLFMATGCTSFNLFTPKINIKEVIAEKERIDKAENPAMQLRLKRELQRKKIVIDDILVKDVTTSSNIDYDFCAIADIEVDGKKIECYIYSPSIKIISELKKNESRISVEGKFQRFFSTLDDYYIKIEITQAKIRIKEGDE